MVTTPKNKKPLHLVESPVTVSLALQGGGTHGAFTWGVLDYILEHNNISIEAISGASTGAVNALALASGLANGGRTGARRNLDSLWKKSAIAASLSPLQPTIVDRMMGNSRLTFSPSFLALDFITSVFSPYQFNLFDLNPLRDIISETVDFSAVRNLKELQVFINATHVKSGGRRVFSNSELSLEAALASTCLPFIFRTAEFQGEGYWEGGFTGNPSLRPLVDHTACTDIIIVQSIPTLDDDIPTKATDILDRAIDISFNAALMLEIEGIETFNRLIDQGKLTGKEFRRINLHLIEASEIISTLGRASKLNADHTFLEYLRDTGRQAAEDWFTNNLNSIGKKTTMNTEAA